MNDHTSGEEVEEQPAAPSRARPTSKLKVLGRSHAMREEQSPPREPTIAGIQQSPPTVVLSPSPPDEDDQNVQSTVEVSSQNSRNSPREDHDENEVDTPLLNGKLPLTKSSQKCGNIRRYCDCQNQNCIKCLKEWNPMLKNRTRVRQQSGSSQTHSFDSTTSTNLSSAECYTDTTGVDLEQFIPDTINRNPKDRALMLRLEEELINLVNDKFQTHYKFPPMTSYHRMLVHRCAAYFGMDHNIDQSGKCIVVNKTKSTRLPEIRFKEHIKEVFNDEPPRRSILKRDSHSVDDYSFKSPDRGYDGDGRKSRSFEEREEAYEKVRKRIFRKDHQESEDFVDWTEMQWSSTESDSYRYRLQPPEFHQGKYIRRLLKVHSEEAEQSIRPCVAKSYSFGGYGGCGGSGVSILSRGDSIVSSIGGPRLLTKQDSGASSVSWRLSPSSSGYKSQSQMSESVTPSPTSTPHPVNNNDQDNNSSSEQATVVWAVSDLNDFPKGSIIIDSTSGRVHKADGTYVYYESSKGVPGLILANEKPERRSRDNVALGQAGTESVCHQKVEDKSPSKINAATSPSLPFSPSPPNRQFQYPQIDPPSAPATYHHHQNPPTDSIVYPQPYLVYTAPYGVPVQPQYDARLQEQSDVSYYVPADGGTTYQTQPPPSAGGMYWNQQQPQFYGTQRYPAPNVIQYPVNYMQQQNGQSNEMMAMYHNQQPVQMIYAAANQVYHQPSQMVYTNPQSIYQPGYQPGYATPPAGSHPTYELQNSLIQLSNNMQQMALNPVQSANSPGPRAFVPVAPRAVAAHQFDPRRGSITKQQLNNNGGGKSRFFVNSSSQSSSTGTNSPAATVVANYNQGPPPPSGGSYQTPPPPSTPPTPHQFTYPPPPPRLFRQMSNEPRGSTPTTTKGTSRSPITIPLTDGGYDRPRFAAFAPNFYHPAMPMQYIVHPGRSQPAVYHRQPTPPVQLMRPPQIDGANRCNNNNNKSRRPRGKPGGLPPTGGK